MYELGSFCRDSKTVPAKEQISERTSEICSRSIVRASGRNGVKGRDERQSTAPAFVPTSRRDFLSPLQKMRT